MLLDSQRPHCVYYMRLYCGRSDGEHLHGQLSLFHRALLRCEQPAVIFFSAMHPFLIYEMFLVT